MALSQTCNWTIKKQLENTVLEEHNPPSCHLVMKLPSAAASRTVEAGCELGPNTVGASVHLEFVTLVLDLLCSFAFSHSHKHGASLLPSTSTFLAQLWWRNQSVHHDLSNTRSSAAPWTLDIPKNKCQMIKRPFIATWWTWCPPHHYFTVWKVQHSITDHWQSWAGAEGQCGGELLPQLPDIPSLVL